MVENVGLEPTASWSQTRRSSQTELILDVCGRLIGRLYCYYSILYYLWRGKINDFYQIFLAGMAGFEPTNARVKVWCLTAWRHPNVFNFFFTVSTIVKPTQNVGAKAIKLLFLLPFSLGPRTASFHPTVGTYRLLCSDYPQISMGMWLPLLDLNQRPAD